MREPSNFIKREELSSDEMLKVIFDYVAKIANEKNLDRVLAFMADMGRKLIVADRCTIWLLDETTQELWTKTGHEISEIRIPSNSGLVGHSVTTNQPIFIEDAYNDQRFNDEVDKATGYITKSILVIPIQNHEGQVIGSYQAINKMTERKTFTSRDLTHLSLAASFAGKSLESALLYKEIEETQKEIIFTMGEISERRSKETGNHIKRVAEYSKILALKYGLNHLEAELIHIASPMHDIGKVAIPDSILMKPGKLTHEEYDIIKTHTETGYQLLKRSNRSILKAASIIAYQHHEKWNGTGYPNQLKETEIHIYARITAVADVFDALSSDRYYKKAWDIEKIIKFLKDQKGEHFEPVLVDLFLENIAEFIEIKNNYSDIFED